jgi:hypothetical protein
MSPVEPGKWYLCAICWKCGQAIPFMHILPDAPVVTDGTDRFNMPCPTCGAMGAYSLANMRKLQAPAKERLQ